VVQLDVDSEVNHVVGPLNPKPVDHREPVFVGGVPGKLCLKGISFQILKNSKFS
jgi:hypothetical protein